MRLAAIAPPILAIAPLAVSADVPPIDARWPEVARTSDGPCDLTVSGNGRFFLISAAGLEPEADGRYVLTNGDMKPIDWQFEASESGRFARYYLPFRWNSAGGVVTVSVTTDRCALATSFEWQRAGTDAQ